MNVNKKQMSEQDIRTKYITPAILAAGWDRDLQIREEVSFTKGKITVRRKTVKRGEQKRSRLYFVLETKHPTGNRGGKRQ